MTMQLRPDDTILVVDIQEKIFGVMPTDRQQMVIKATVALLELADVVGCNVVYTEQYPAGLGPTNSTVLASLEKVDATRVEKRHFDCCAAPDFAPVLDRLGRRVVVAGVETHVCVLTSVLSLRRLQKEVIVPFDTVASRDDEYRRNGLDSMADAGVDVTNVETILFATLHTSEHEEFRRLSRLIR